jgi:hypothetical protein
MKMPDPARRERQRALIEKVIETPFSAITSRYSIRPLARWRCSSVRPGGWHPIHSASPTSRLRLTSNASTGLDLQECGRTSLGDKSLEQLDDYVKSETVRWAKVIKNANLAGTQ